jgi:tetratricopeptide (TPR) repeat protein
LVGCSVSQPSINEVGKKSFENEDYMILAALDQQKSGNHANAMQIYRVLYEKSGKLNYLIEATKISFLSNNIEQTEQMLQEALEKSPKNSELRRIEVGFLVKQKKNSEAQKKILLLLEDDKSVRNLKIAGSIYLQSKSYELALKYFESAYRIDSDENSLLHIVDIQYNYLGKKDDAIALLETHIRMQTCEVNSCFKLIEIYGKEKNINGVVCKKSCGVTCIY